mgnify:CR=1 FL=1
MPAALVAAVADAARFVGASPADVVPVGAVGASGGWEPAVVYLQMYPVCPMCRCWHVGSRCSCLSETGPPPATMPCLSASTARRATWHVVPPVPPIHTHLLAPHQVTNATTAINAVLAAVPLRRGDWVLMFNTTYPAVRGGRGGGEEGEGRR